MMKKSVTFSGIETSVFGQDNNLRVFPPTNSYKFKPREHIILDEVQECILNNFWFQYNNKREEKGYMLSILNSIAEYFHHINKILPTPNIPEAPKHRPIYVVYDGKQPGLYITFEEIVSQKMEANLIQVGMSWKKYNEIDEALSKARAILGVNYYIEPAAKEYFQNFKLAKTKGIQQRSSLMNTAQEGPSKPTYKQTLQKEIDPLDSEYIDWKIIGMFEQTSPQYKKVIKEKS